MLADCYVKAGRRHAAMAMYMARLQDMGLQDPRYAFLISYQQCNHWLATS
jgi:hypothetical protein